MTHWIHSPTLVCALTLALIGVAGFLPITAVEPLLFGLGTIVPPSMVVPVALMATATHMTGKTIAFLSSGAVERVLPQWQRNMIARACERLAGHRSLQIGTLLLSGTTGLPPFTIVTVACGVLRVPLRNYLIAGSVGRAIRFSLLIAGPRLLGL